MSNSLGPVSLYKKILSYLVLSYCMYGSALNIRDPSSGLSYIHIKGFY